MAVELDRDTIERFRKLSPRDAFLQAKDTAYRAGATSSEDLLDLFEQLVDQKVLSWAEVEEYDRSPSR